MRRVEERGMTGFAMRSTWRKKNRLHVAIILDGNGRWAVARGRSRAVGHRAGARAARRVVEAAARRGVGVLTLFAFSADNWRRPAAEVEALMTLFQRYLAMETARCCEQGVRLNVIGRRDRLAPSLVSAIERAESLTGACSEMLLRLAVDYSARHSLARAAGVLAERESGDAPIDDGRFARALERGCHSVADVPAVDLLIRTSGEQRLSDFLLWECAYAELVFTPTLWPDFDAADLAAALAELGRRQRRFGGLPPSAADASLAFERREGSALT
jgi:undecaprenyl diphosphate synthase